VRTPENGEESDSGELTSRDPSVEDLVELYQDLLTDSQVKHPTGTKCRQPLAASANPRKQRTIFQAA